jgi:hypothetical protein
MHRVNKRKGHKGDDEITEDMKGWNIISSFAAWALSKLPFAYSNA